MMEFLICGNWKSHKTPTEAVDWVSAFGNEFSSFPEAVEVVVCVPFTVLLAMHWALEELNLALGVGVQDISRFPEGSHTGEVAVGMVRDLVSYVLIGHSERRREQEESDEWVNAKLARLKEDNSHITPVVCVSNHGEVEALVEADVYPAGEGMVVAYEPLSAIGSGRPAEPEAVRCETDFIRESLPQALIIYGGSVTASNVRDYLDLESVEGVLPGGASLSAGSFASLIKAVLD